MALSRTKRKINESGLMAACKPNTKKEKKNMFWGVWLVTGCH